MYRCIHTPDTHTHTHTHIDTSNYPTAAEIIDILHTKVAILSGGRDRQGRSVITFPAHPKGFELNRDAIRKVIQYLACIPT